MNVIAASFWGRFLQNQSFGYLLGSPGYFLGSFNSTTRAGAPVFSMFCVLRDLAKMLLGQHIKADFADGCATRDSECPAARFGKIESSPPFITRAFPTGTSMIIDPARKNYRPIFMLSLRIELLANTGNPPDNFLILSTDFIVPCASGIPVLDCLV
jgi:hypothetical protein